MKAIVIGGGIIGTSTAFRLAQSGARVTLLEAGVLASGTSSTSFAWVNSNNKAPIEYHRLNVAGMAEHMRLAEEFGRAPWLHIEGNVIWETPADTGGANEPAVPVSGESMDAKAQRLREWNYPMDLLTPRELAMIHPAIRLPDGVERVAYFPTEGYVDVPLLIASLAQTARALGVDIQTGQKVDTLVRQGSRVVGVRTTAGAEYLADVVVSCTGRWTDEVTALTGVTIPMAPTPGLLVLSTPTPTTLRCLAHSTTINMRPAGGSRILMASFPIDDLLDLNMPEVECRDYADEILRRATAVLPDLEGSTVESYRVGIRSIPADGFPVVGALPGVDGFYVIATHSGVTMGPFLGRLAAAEILAGLRDERLAPFLPDRLLAN
jgi:glycine/D-amino acid oxidase-like deaminating enzyme